MPNAGTSFPLGLAATVYVLGTFAAHIDTTSCSGEDVQALLTMSSGYGEFGGNSDRTWRTTITAHFQNHDQSEDLMDTGGAIRVGDIQLGVASGSYYYHSFLHEIAAGSSSHIRFPGGSEVPALDDTLHFFAEELVLTNPSEPGLSINRQEPFTVTWNGAGSQMVWLTIYGSGADGSFVFNGKMRPNSGAFILTPEDMAGYEENAAVTIFLQRTRACPLVGDGYHQASYYYFESVSSMSVVIP